MYPSINTYKFKSLSELMVPLPITLQTVQYIEGCASYDIDVIRVSKDGTQHKANDELYTIPYPYIEPINPEFAQIGSSIHMLSEDIINQWQRQIDSRVYPISNFAITKKYIDTFDADPDNACFISALTGYIVSFNYTSITDVKLVTIPNNVASLMSNFLKMSHVSPEAVEASGVPKSEMAKTFFQDAYSRFYSFTPKGEDKSKLLTDKRHYFEATSNGRCVLTADQAKKINERALVSFYNHERIIMTV